MGDAVATFIVKTMLKKMKDHSDLISGSENLMNNLVYDVGLMEATLWDSGGQSMTDDLKKAREREVRNVLYQAEDIFDEFLTRAALQKSSRFGINRYVDPSYVRMANKVKSFKKKTVEPLFARYEIGRDINNNSKSRRSDEKTNSNAACSTGEASTSRNSIDRYLYHQDSPMIRGSVVGLEKEATEIMDHLTDESHETPLVFSITGMPGLGKTTLARKIFTSKTLRDFSIVIWVNVSKKFEKRKVFLSILKSLTTEDMNGKSDDILALIIRYYLKYQKFFLIFDDIWNEQDWDDIEQALPMCNSLGRVLITSQIQSVADKANRRRGSYNLGFLDEHKSWDLLQLQVFGNLIDCPSDLRDIGKEIARKCDGLPFAIMIIAGVLSTKTSQAKGQNDLEVQWKQVLRNVPKFFNKNSEAKKLIAMSYNELPLDLRNCFLYLGVFPRESSIPVQRLIRMWIAEGFICQRQNMNMRLEDVAEDNLKELIDRNLVMVDDVKPDGRVKTCRVHSLIREFCKNEASVENSNLFQEMEMPTQGGVFCQPVSAHWRRICIHSHIDVFLRGNPKGPLMHSLLCSGQEAVTSLPAKTSPIPRHFKRLRVVDVTPIKLTKFPSKLAKLIHLRYIALSADGDGDDLWAVPEKVSKLWNLQSITIDTNSRTFKFDANLWKMMHLRHLKTKAAIILRGGLNGPAGEQLQSVSRLSTQCCTQDLFNKAKNIQNLGICGDLNNLKSNCLSELNCLRKLKLVHDVYPEVASEKPLRCLPDNLFPPNLTILQLSGTFLPWNQICLLEKLLALEILKLKNNAFVGKYWLNCKEGCFRSLEILIIEDTDLAVWDAGDGNFPKLKYLELKDCKELEEIPFALKNLQMVHVGQNVSDSAIASAKKMREELKRQGNSDGSSGFKLIIN